MMNNRIFSGIQPTGDLHLGNYLGAIRNWVDLQADYECIFCIVDQHAITTFQDPKELQESTLSAAAALMASGIKIDKHILFNQSLNPDHASLAWVFNCVARIGWLNRMTQFKEKAGKNRENASSGLYIYPNLMAADILVYKATHVPVGEDQKQHLELARDIAMKFNNDWGSDDFFTPPEPLIFEVAARVMSLRDGTKKMSKSDPSDMSRITFADSADDIVKKIRKAKTDPEPLPSEMAGLEGRLEAINLLGIYAALQRQTPAQSLQQAAGKSFADFKGELADILIAEFAPITAEMQRLLQDKAELLKQLRDGAMRAQSISQPVLQAVYDKIGFLR